jgi:3D (Asp-Asp-Asp) domain-containing protein
MAAGLLLLCSVATTDTPPNTLADPKDEVPPKREEARPAGWREASGKTAGNGNGVSVAGGRTDSRASFAMESSAYCEGGTTASGQQTHDGVAASNRFPFGTRIRLLTGPLAGKVVEIQDRHAKRFTNLLDVFIQSCAAALEYGRRQIKVAVL